MMICEINLSEVDEHLCQEEEEKKISPYRLHIHLKQHK